MGARKAVRHAVFNDNIDRGASNTLRRSDVGKAKELAERMGREIIDSQLGDPTRHGLSTYHHLSDIHTEVCMSNDIRIAITDIAQKEGEEATAKSLRAILQAEDPVGSICAFLEERLGSRAGILGAKARLIGKERLVLTIRDYLQDPLGPTPTSYLDSSGFVGLRGVLAARSGCDAGDGIRGESVFIGCGVSGVVRALYKTVLKPIETASHEKIGDLVSTITGTYPEITERLGDGGDKWLPWRKLQRKVADIQETVDERPEVIVPEACYPLYYAESAFAGAKIAHVRLRKEDGQLDLGELERTISVNTRVINLITVGNPIGIGMKKDVFLDALRIINRTAKDFGRPIFVVCDTIYEPFRMDREERIEPVRLHARLHGEEGMDHAVVIDVSSISKMAAVPGVRIGWAKVSWLGETFKEERDLFLKEYMVNVQNPLLTPSASDWQMASREFFVKLDKDPGFRDEYERFKGERRAECNRRVWGFVEGLERINKAIMDEFGASAPPIVFHPGYYVDGEMDRMRFNNFYVVFGFNQEYAPRDSEYSAARRIADFAGWNGEPGGGFAVPLFTPGGNFPFLVDDGERQDYMRAVALFSDERREKVLQTIEAYARLIVGAWSRKG